MGTLTPSCLSCYPMASSVNSRLLGKEKTIISIREGLTLRLTGQRTGALGGIPVLPDRPGGQAVPPPSPFTWVWLTMCVGGRLGSPPGAVLDPHNFALVETVQAGAVPTYPTGWRTGPSTAPAASQELSKSGDRLLAFPVSVAAQLFPAANRLHLCSDRSACW